MKLLLIILGIALCTALPSFRGLQDTTVAEDIDAGDDFPKWLFADVAVTVSGEEDLSGVAQEEEQLENNEEEALPQGETLLDQIRNDPALNDIFNFGVGAVISGGITKGKIPSTTFIVADVSDMITNTSKAGVRYLFSCAVVSKDGDSVINMNFTVYYAFSNQQKSLRAFSYVIKTTTPFTIDESKYITVSQEEIDTNPVIKEGLEYAIDEVVNQADQYSISEINSVQTQTVKTTVYYKYNVELTNNKDKKVNLVTTVAYHPDTGKMKIESYSTTTTTTTVTTTTTTTTSPRK